MPHYSVAKTKDALSNLIDRALAGEEVIVTRHGKPTVELRAVVDTASRASDKTAAMERLRRVREAGPRMDTSFVDLIRQMRDEGTG